MAILDAFKNDSSKDKPEPKYKHPEGGAEVLLGEVIEGEMYSDGMPLTPQLVEVEENRQRLAEEQRESGNITVRNSQTVARAGKPINTDLLDIPKVCDQCYLMDKCAHYKPKHSCYYTNQVKVDNPTDLVDLVKMVLEIQGQRVLFGRVIEQSEGGYIDKNLSDEMKRLLEYMKMFKDLSAPHDSGEGIEIKVKGKAATQAAAGGGSILSSIFGGGTSS